LINHLTELAHISQSEMYAVFKVIMKTQKIFLLLFMLPLFVIAQNLDTKTLKVEYDEYVTFVSSKVNKYKGVLYDSNNIAFYKTIYLVNDNKDIQNSKEKTEQTEETILVVKATNSDKYFSEVVTNRKTKELTEHLYEFRALKDYFSVYETQPEMKWELLDEEKQINNYNCKKAKTIFRGRSYQVWYTPEIPISVGPWKFSGLPGLILSVTDTTNGYYTWEATSVIYPYKGDEFSVSEVISDKVGFTKISYKDFDIKFFEEKKEGARRARSQRGDREMKVKFGYSTFQHKEPINEWRTQTNFEF